MANALTLKRVEGLFGMIGAFGEFGATKTRSNKAQKEKGKGKREVPHAPRSQAAVSRRTGQG